ARRAGQPALVRRQPAGPRRQPRHRPRAVRLPLVPRGAEQLPLPPARLLGRAGGHRPCRRIVIQLPPEVSMRYASLFGALLLFGCSSAPIQQYTVTFPSLTVDPGVEKTQCVVLNLHNPTEIHIG